MKAAGAISDLILHLSKLPPAVRVEFYFSRERNGIRGCWLVAATPEAIRSAIDTIFDLAETHGGGATFDNPLKCGFTNLKYGGGLYASRGDITTNLFRIIGG